MTQLYYNRLGELMDPNNKCGTALYDKLMSNKGIRLGCYSWSRTYVCMLRGYSNAAEKASFYYYNTQLQKDG